MSSRATKVSALLALVLCAGCAADSEDVGTSDSGYPLERAQPGGACDRLEACCATLAEPIAACATTTSASCA
jgi:hypothetical protein